jgi:hypothetical protein
MGFALHTPNIFQEIITSHEVEAKSVDNENPLFDHKSIRGFAGIATCWKKNLSHAVKVQEEGNHRIMVTTIACKPTPICIIRCASPWALLCIPLIKSCYPLGLDCLFG